MAIVRQVKYGQGAGILGSRWTGKIIGGILGLLLAKGSILGLLLGMLLGHQFDRGFAGGGFAGFSRVSPARRRAVFFETVFLAMGHLAKADGRVSPEEIQAARAYMHALNLAPEEVQRAIDLFTRGKDPAFPLERQIGALQEVCRGQPDLVRSFLEVMVDMSLSKGHVTSAERDLLWRMAAGLNVGRMEMAQLEALIRAQRTFRGGGYASQGAHAPDALAQAYAALGLASNASDKDVKTAYRRLMNQHHPDKLAARGLPESMLEGAKERTREIRSAYEIIRDHRGMQ